MNPCLRPPASLADAQAILTCFAGPDWRNLAVMGLELVAFLAFGILVAYLLLRRVI